MATITDLRVKGTTLISTPKEILEPVGAPAPLQGKLERFGDHYDLSTNSHLYRFLVALCGDAGAGSLKKELLFPKLQSLLEGTYFNDLDRLYGNPIALPRLSSEIYSVDPRNEALTSDQWADVQAKDSLYRARCLLWMRAIILGPTLDGIKLAAQAATGYECDVYEQYQYLDNAASDNPLTMTDIGQTSNRNEFIIVPLVPSPTEQEKRRIIQLIDRLRPINSIPTIYDGGDAARTQLLVGDSSSTTENFLILRFVTGRTDVDWPSVNPANGEWIEAGIEKQAPTFAFVDRQEAVTFLSVNSVTASSEHLGSFSSTQTSLFQHLANAPSDGQFRADRSYAKNVAPVQLSIPWTSSS